MSNNYNNDSLPFQQKIVAMKVEQNNVPKESIIETIAKLFHAIYGIVILIFDDERIAVSTSNAVPQKTILTAQRILDEPIIEDYLEIIPFPKK